MSKIITLRKGLDINLRGKAQESLADAPQASEYALSPLDFEGVTPKLLVKVGDEVKAGTPLFFNKYSERVLFTSPVSGTVAAVNRGEKRKVLSVTVTPDATQSYEEFAKPDLQKASREEIVELLLRSGLWPMIVQRPYGIIADPNDTPKAVFVSAFDSAPLAPDYNFVLRNEQKNLQAGIEVILVSSGAVASGRSVLEQRTGRIDTVSARQLFSAVGQVKLLNRYYDLFNEYGIVCGQVLTTKESLSTRRQYLNQRNCMETMLANGVLPIVNENDTISVTELMFTDNDELSGLVAAMMNAEALIILSNIDGIYDGSPADPASQVIRRVKPSEDLSQYIDPVRSSRGRGGMATKSRVSSRAAAEGIEVIIANGRRDGILTDLVLAAKDVPCTRFEPAPRAASGVKKWIASSEGFAKGILRIDQGAAAAVRASKAASILAVGVTAVEGDFERDDLVRILSPDGAQLAVGRISCDSATARRNIGRKGLKPLVHCDYLYLE